MPIITDEALKLVKDALDQYETAVEGTHLAQRRPSKDVPVTRPAFCYVGLKTISNQASTSDI